MGVNDILPIFIKNTTTMRKDNEKKTAESIRFVTSHYEPDVFDASKAWKKSGIRSGLKHTSIIWLSAAAVAAIILTITFIRPADTTQYDVDITANAKTTYALPDGSSVTLTAGSRLAYDSSTFATNRHVTISGQAFFEVMPDKSHPFSVTDGLATATVLGTSFGISRINDTSTMVAVETGMVKVTCNDRSEVVTPGQTVVASAEGLTVSESEINVNSWATNHLDFDDTPLPKAIKNIEEAYDVKITDCPTDNSILLTISYTGDVDKLIDIINELLNLNLKIQQE